MEHFNNCVNIKVLNTLLISKNNIETDFFSLYFNLINYPVTLTGSHPEHIYLVPLTLYGGVHLK